MKTPRSVPRRQFTDLTEPIRVVAVEEGPAGEIVWTPGGMVQGQAAADRECAMRQRPAWGVTLSGLHPTECHDQDPCPLAETQQELAIDRENGDLLYGVLYGVVPPDPGSTPESRGLTVLHPDVDSRRRRSTRS